jgi:hypothetical protein
MVNSPSTQTVAPAASLVHSRYNPEVKFGRIKRQHGRVNQLDPILDRLVSQCPFVSRIVPGRIKVRRGKTPPAFTVQYPTTAGVKCQFVSGGAVQEIFLICSDSEKTIQWLKQHPPT